MFSLPLVRELESEIAILRTAHDHRTLGHYVFRTLSLGAVNGIRFGKSSRQSSISLLFLRVSSLHVRIFHNH